jgi:SAM-dependent methyltransferase
MKIYSNKYPNVLEAKKAFKEGVNLISELQSHSECNLNLSSIIEFSYDIQAGSYVEGAKANIEYLKRYSKELAKILSSNIKTTDTILDIGTGEMTTLSHVLSSVDNNPAHCYALDISWSRIFKGLEYAKNNMGVNFSNLTPFVADIREIPLLDKSINITISNHALEPNGENLKNLMLEIFRVTRDLLILFEPCYEINSKAGKERMDSLGYIKNIDGVVKDLGGQLIEKINIINIANPLNPTVCFLIQPPSVKKRGMEINSCKDILAVPGTNIPLKNDGEFYFSHETGLFFPILKSIPVLKYQNAILGSALFDEPT